MSNNIDWDNLDYLTPEQIEQADKDRVVDIATIEVVIYHPYYTYDHSYAFDAVTKIAGRVIKSDKDTATLHVTGKILRKNKDSFEYKIFGNILLEIVLQDGTRSELYGKEVQNG